MDISIEDFISKSKAFLRDKTNWAYEKLFGTKSDAERKRDLELVKMTQEGKSVDNEPEFQLGGRLLHGGAIANPNLVDPSEILKSKLVTGIGGAIDDYVRKNNEAYKTIKPGQNISIADRLTPKYGKFAGPNWIAGEYNTNVDVDRILKTDPVDGLDYVTKLHDIRYSLATSPADLKEADRIMLRELDKINYNDLGPEGKRYYTLAKNAFKTKLASGLGYSISNVIDDATVRGKLSNYLLHDRSYGFAPEEFTPTKVIDTNMEQQRYKNEFRNEISDTYNTNLKLVDQEMLDNEINNANGVADVEKDIDLIHAIQEILYAIED